VTVIAYDLGYERPAAFSTMFRKMTGHVPSAHPAALAVAAASGGHKKAGHFAPANHSARDAEETIDEGRRAWVLSSARIRHLPGAGCARPPDCM
jgi:AraC-like DNA-binding protein